MKSLKSLFAVLTIAAFSFACASTNEAPTTTTANTPEVTTPTDNAAFSGGNDVKPILTRPKV